MGVEHWDYVARRPRHQVVDPDRVRVEVQRVAANQCEVLQAEMVDFSKAGVQLRVATGFTINDAVNIRVYCESTGFECRLASTVRWCKRRQGETWSLGCQFDSEADWEVIGELFLNGVLSREPEESAS